MTEYFGETVTKARATFEFNFRNQPYMFQGDTPPYQIFTANIWSVVQASTLGPFKGKG